MDLPLANLDRSRRHLSGQLLQNLVRLGRHKLQNLMKQLHLLTPFGAAVVEAVELQEERDR